MSNLDRVPRHIYGLHQRTLKAPGRANSEPTASNHQMFALPRQDSAPMLQKHPLINMNYIFANQQPLHQVQILVDISPRKAPTTPRTYLTTMLKQRTPGKTARACQNSADDFIDVHTYQRRHTALNATLDTHLPKNMAPHQSYLLTYTNSPAQTNKT